MADHASSSSSTNTGQVYEVFLNHRGPDTKKGLASHIYRRLIVRGLNVFLDQQELRKGENILHQIKEAIRTASVQVAIFSPTYAQSTWCLEELALMVESESESKSTIIPVFLDVDPSELRWTQSGDGEFAGVQSIFRWIPQSILRWIFPQSILRWIFPSLQGEKGSYARDLHMLEKKTTLDPNTNKKKPRHDSSTLLKWRKALSVFSNKSGFVLDAYDGVEWQLVDAVVEEVWRKVRKTPLNVAKYPTGLDEKIEHVKRIVLLQQQSQKTRVVGIVGLGGVGKTTLAKEFFNRHRSTYDRCCFLFDVRETAAKSSLSSLQAALLKDLTDLNEQIRDTHEGIGKLRKHLSSRPQCLIVLDDVDHIDQLDALFSPVKDTIQSSSLILVTSRKRDVLRSAGIIEDSIYPQTGLNRQHSRALFCSHAFDQSCPVPGFEQLVEEFLDFCVGLPLSLKVVGAAIRGEDSEFWKRHLDKIRRLLPEDIRSKLKISYDGLGKEEQEMFLDVACFFIGENRDTAIAIWNVSEWDGWLGLRNLENRCLLEIDSEECIRMHDHLRDLGRDVAEKEHPLRLSRPNVNLLHTLSPLSPVRGISMAYGNGSEQFCENVADNCNLSRLELLRGEGSFVESVFSAGELRQLIYLQWEKCPISSISFTGITRNLRVLYIQGEELNTLWQHESEAPRQLRELYIDAPLSEVPQSIGKLNQLEKLVLKNGCFKTLPNEFYDMHSWNLRVLHIEGKNLKTLWQHESEAPRQLRELYIEAPLSEVPQSIGKLNQLEKIVLKNGSFKTLPNEFYDMHSLKHITLQNCEQMMLLPDSVGTLTGLQTLKFSGCYRLEWLPDSVGQLTGLQTLDLSRCFRLQGLPESVGQLTGLEKLNLHGCSSLQGLPDSVGQLTSLGKLDLEYCSSLQGLPDSVGQLTRLGKLNFAGCSSLQGLPDSVGQLTGLEGLYLFQCSSLQGLPDSVGQLTGLEELYLTDCSSLQGLPDSVGQLTGLQTLHLRNCSSLQGLPDSVGQLTGLQTLDLRLCSSLQGLPDSVGQLTGLEKLDLTRCSSLQGLPDSVGQLTGLQTLDLSWCSSLQGLPDSVGQLTGLQTLDLKECTSLQGLPDSVGQLTGLQTLDLNECTSLQGLPDSVGQLTGLQTLHLSGCSSLQGLPDSVGQLTGMEKLYLSGCFSLQGLPDSVGQLTGLQVLHLTSCCSLQGLPDSVGQLTALEILYLNGCRSLQGLPESVGNLTRLKWLHLAGCPNLQTLPNVQHLSSLVKLHVHHCPKLQWGAGVIESLRHRLGNGLIE